MRIPVTITRRGGWCVRSPILSGSWSALELEALVLEMNLIKKHRPKYNVRLKDDKRYPYIKVHWNEPFPKVTVTRHLGEDGWRFSVRIPPVGSLSEHWMCSAKSSLI